MSKALHVLIVEDSPADAELIMREVRRSGFDPVARRVETEEAMLEALKEPPDVVLSDYSMPQFSGLRAAEILQGTGLNIPFILISGTVGEELAVEAMKFGATDYVLKDRMGRLGASIERALEQKRLREGRKLADEKIRSQLGELQRWQECMLDREDRIMELKREVNELLARQGEPPRYAGQQ